MFGITEAGEVRAHDGGGGGSAERECKDGNEWPQDLTGQRGAKIKETPCLKKVLLDSGVITTGELEDEEAMGKSLDGFQRKCGAGHQQAYVCHG